MLLGQPRWFDIIFPSQAEIIPIGMCYIWEVEGDSSQIFKIAAICCFPPGKKVALPGFSHPRATKPPPGLIADLIGFPFRTLARHTPPLHNRLTQRPLGFFLDFSRKADPSSPDRRVTIGPASAGGESV